MHITEVNRTSSGSATALIGLYAAMAVLIKVRAIRDVASAWTITSDLGAH